RRLEVVREMIMEDRRSEAIARPSPSGVVAGDGRTGFLNASEAGLCSRWLWYAKHGIATAGEIHPPYGVFDRGHAFEHWCTTYLAAGLTRVQGRLLYAGAKQRRLMLPGFPLAAPPARLIERPPR